MAASRVQQYQQAFLQLQALSLPAKSDVHRLVDGAARVFRGSYGHRQMKSFQYSIEACWLGQLLVAASENGICAILLGDDTGMLRGDLQRRFPTANLRRGGGALRSMVDEVIDVVTEPWRALVSPLDLHGTAFQLRVWEAMRQIPCGSTSSYTHIAQSVGRPQSVRAVAQACGANPVAVVIPCHRVIRLDGSLSGYRWGVQRKRQLQRRERAHFSGEDHSVSFPAAAMDACDAAGSDLLIR